MRFQSTLLAALPLLAPLAAGAADTPDSLAQVKEPLQKALAKVVAYTGHPHRYDADEAAAIKDGPTGMTVLALHNWKDTLFESVRSRSAAAEGPEEWWVFFSGGNKTCFGQCDKVTAAWNASAAELRRLPSTPHLGYINCEQQPVLCSSLGAGAGTIWSFEIPQPPAEPSVYRKRLNLTTTTTDDIIALWEAGSKEGWASDVGPFHPFQGWIPNWGLAVPLGYLMWAVNVLPQWAFIMIVSLLSRTMMSRRMQPQVNRPRQPAQ